MSSRYRLPLYTTRIGLSTGSKEAASDGWFYPKDLAEENALIAAGCQADDLGNPLDNGGAFRPTEVSQLRAVVRAANKSIYGAGYNERPFQHSVLPFGTAAINDTNAGGGTYTRTPDAINSINGRASTLVQVTGAGGSPNFEVGVAAATVTLSSEARLAATRTACAFVKIGAGNTLSTATLYIGNGDYSAFHTFGLLVAGVTADGWTVLVQQTAGPSGTTGSPDLTAPVRAKLRLTMTGNVQPGDIRVGGAYIIPRAAPTVVFMLDDGYSVWPWLVREAKQRGVPLSLGISPGYIGQSGFMTEKQTIDIIQDDSGLVECTNHAWVNDSYSTIGLGPYMTDVNNCRDWLLARGATPAAARCHAYVQGQNDQTLRDVMKSSGYLCAREVGASTGQGAVHTAPSVIGASADSLFKLPAACNLDVAYNLPTVQGYITNAASVGTAVMMGHSLGSTAGALRWIQGYDPSYGILDLLDWLALMRDTQGWRLMRLSDWHADMTSRAPILLT